MCPNAIQNSLPCEATVNALVAGLTSVGVAEVELWPGSSLLESLALLLEDIGGLSPLPEQIDSRKRIA